MMTSPINRTAVKLTGMSVAALSFRLGILNLSLAGLLVYLNLHCNVNLLFNPLPYRLLFGIGFVFFLGGLLGLSQQKPVMIRRKHAC